MIKIGWKNWNGINLELEVKNMGRPKGSKNKIQNIEPKIKWLGYCWTTEELKRIKAMMDKAESAGVSPYQLIKRSLLLIADEEYADLAEKVLKMD
jgi:hypothetical protein